MRDVQIQELMARRRELEALKEQLAQLRDLEVALQTSYLPCPVFFILFILTNCQSANVDSTPMSTVALRP